jgi:hypothetical protein
MKKPGGKTSGEKYFLETHCHIYDGSLTALWGRWATRGADVDIRPEHQPKNGQVSQRRQDKQVDKSLILNPTFAMH